MNGESNMVIDPDIDEELTELLGDLYEKWKYCSCGIGTEKDKREVFLRAIKRRLEKGFSIITDPGRFRDEMEMERILGKMYRIWKNYMKDYLGDGATVDIFIDTARHELEMIVEKKDSHWKKEIDDK